MTDAGETQVQFDIVVSAGFVLSEYAALVDALRIANRVASRPRFGWQALSRNGGLVESSSQAVVQSQPLGGRPDAGFLFVVGNSDPDAPELSLSNTVRTYTNRGAQVFLLAEAATRYIYETGHPQAPLSTHWENAAILRERGSFEADTRIASQNGEVVTCAGMGSTLDVVLSVIGRFVTAAELVTLTNIFLHERIRDFRSNQPFTGHMGLFTGDHAVDRAIALMQQHIEEPISIRFIVERLQTSNRTLERRFRDHLNCSPNTFYRQLRLARANNLLLNTDMSIQAIALACGFTERFSSIYHDQYGLTPLRMRKRGKKRPPSMRHGENCGNPAAY